MTTIPFFSPFPNQKTHFEIVELLKVLVVSQLFLEFLKRPQITHYISSSFYRRRTLLCKYSYTIVKTVVCGKGQITTGSSPE